MLLLSLLFVASSSCTKLDKEANTVAIGTTKYTVSRMAASRNAIFFYGGAGIEDATMVFTFGKDTVAPAAGTYKVVAKASAPNEADLYALITSTSVVKYNSTGEGDIYVTLGSNGTKPTIQFSGAPVKSGGGTTALMSADIMHLQ